MIGSPSERVQMQNSAGANKFDLSRNFQKQVRIILSQVASLWICDSSRRRNAQPLLFTSIESAYTHKSSTEASFHELPTFRSCDLIPVPCDISESFWSTLKYFIFRGEITANHDIHPVNLFSFQLCNLLLLAGVILSCCHVIFRHVTNHAQISK